ncbi:MULTISPECIES: TonB-dependent siderophore receptor [unclassified Citrobacter]|uniref:TonB-dependent receptor n=1 Tax=unclassified Citrobacter TaxID=2644389 RepID=UPI001660ED38|nr:MULTISPECIES: TonB-dependent siderophore receptor [unclassified Citrobacter]MBD0803505.1 TonB-dependent siderophore receptor [Citrobacter sp. C6_1]MBD0811244.1 TonB-dependent siderophore receptor [Citrobacter sp. C6_2]
MLNCKTTPIASGLLTFSCLAAPLSAHADDTITVTASAPAQSSFPGQEPAAAEKKATIGSLGQRELIDVPWSVQTLSKKVIDQQQIKDVKDVYRYIPSVQGEGVRPQTRGMQGSVVQNHMIDGLNAVSTTEYPTEQFQNIDVLSGIAGSLYGSANPAGMFNLVSKRPLDMPLHRVTVGQGTGSGTLASLDFSGPVDAGDRVKYRLNLMNDEGRSYTTDSHVRRQYAGLGLDFQLTDKTVLESNFSYYHYYEKGMPGSFALAKGVQFPSAFDPTNSKYGQSYAGHDDETTTADMHIKHDFDGNWMLDLGALHQVADRESTAVTNTLTDNWGHYTTTTSNSAASRFTINSYLANLTGNIDSGWLTQDIATGMRGFVWKNYNPRNGGTFTLGHSSLDQHPDYPRPPYPDFTNRYHSATTTQHAFLLSDTLHFTPQWSLLLSGSENLFTVSNYNKSGHETSRQKDNGMSGSASLMYKPVENVTLYTTWADSLQQGDTAPAGASNAGHVLDPYRSHQVEVGAKYAPVKDLLLTAALFEAKRPFAYTNDNGEFAQDGTQKNRGLELMADGHITENLRVLGGAAWLDPMLHNTAASSADGKQVVGLPRFTSNVLAVYSIEQVQGLDVDANVHYVGRRATDNANDTWVGSYTTVDIGSRYATRLWNTPTTFRFDITNLTDRRYWTNIVPGALTGYTGAGAASAQLGAPRQAQISVQVDF